MSFALLLTHGLLAIFLLGAITHQALRLLWPVRRPDPGFVTALRAVNGRRYVNAVIVLYVLTWVLGAIVYAPYRLEVKPVLEELNLAATNGIFEIKENIATIGLGVLPLYWLAWKKADPGLDRVVLTSLLCVMVWYSLIVGHVLNNFRGAFVMERLQRVIPLFSASFSVLYVAAFGAAFAPVVYHPLINRAFREAQGPEAGPAMFYYGWFIAALGGALALSLLGLLIPQSWTRRIPASTSWIVVLLAIVWLCYLERRWFLG